MNSQTLATCILLAFSGVISAVAQQGGVAAGGLSPIPTVTPNFTVPEESTQFVFLGPRISELTISYPANLQFAKPSGPRRTYLVKMLNQVSPVVFTTVTPNPDGTYDYVYSIRNEEGAKDPIALWSIAMPATDAVLSASHPQWTASKTAAPGHSKPLPNAASMSPVMFSSWQGAGGAALAPGQQVEGMRIRSPYRPGFTLLYARSAEDYALPEDAPAAVREQLEVMRGPEWMNRAVIVIGPRFPKEWGREIMADDFEHGIARLAQEGELDPSSKFVTAIKDALDVVHRSGQAVSPLGGAGLAAATPLEAAIQNAISLSLK